jgi:hypothetical protein
MTQLRNSLILVGLTIVTFGPLVAQTKIIPVTEDQNVLEFVGQFNNTPTTSQQFGYVSRIQGLDDTFNGTPQNEATALFTFVTNATTDRVIANGPLRIVNRTGTTTIYLNTPPSDFSNPASFSQGTPIQVSTYRQQVVLNTLTNAFVTTHMNTVAETHVFWLNGTNYRLGRVRETFRTSYSGQSNTPGAAPSGWFGGNAIGATSGGTRHQSAPHVGLEDAW